jgi:hypothetical protein
MSAPRVRNTKTRNRRSPRRSPAPLKFKPGDEPQGFSTDLRQGRGFMLRIWVLPRPGGLSVDAQMDAMEPHFQRVEPLDGP